MPLIVIARQPKFQRLWALVAALYIRVWILWGKLWCDERTLSDAQIAQNGWIGVQGLMCWDGGGGGGGGGGDGGGGRAWLMPKIRESHPLLKPACYTMLYLNNYTVELDHCKLFHVEDYCTRHTLWYNTQIEKQTTASCRLGYQAHLHSWKSRVGKGGARSTNGPVTRRVGWQIRQGWSVKSGALMSLKVPRWKKTGLEALYQPRPTEPILGRCVLWYHKSL